MGDLLEAYDGVVSSSTGIIRNNQRHLYNNMFDLLQTTTRASATSNITISNDICEFWYSDILPICFDDDISIQNSAVESISIFVKNIESKQFHSSPKWPQLKQQIIANYIEKLNKMRDQINCNWYKIWCILIRVLNHEIIRSASIINTFLSVVEHGFRSQNYDIRAEAFICWKVLVEVFAQNNELKSEKRIKLISIPLRSSHAKTMEAAINKFKVWWYFLLQLNDNIHINCEMTFEPFLQFCFGTPFIKNSIHNSNNNYGQLKSFNDAKEMSVIALIEILGSSHKEIHLLLEKYELDATEETLITESIMQKSYKYIMKACFEATLIIIELFKNNRIKLIELLWRNVISQIIQTKNSKIYKECCIIIKELIRYDYDNPNLNIKSFILQICDIFGTHYAFLMTTFNNRESIFDLNQISETIIDFSDILLTSGNLYFNIDNYKPIIKNIYDIDEYKESSKYWDMIKKLIENILNTDQLDNFNNFDTKLEIWKSLSIPIVTYLDIKLFEFRINKKAELINNWLFWPLNKIVLTKLSLDCIKNDLKYFDDDFINIWKKLMKSSSNAEGKSNFQIYVFENFVNFTENRERIPKFQEILSCYINCWDKKFDSSSAPKEQLNLITRYLSKSPQKNENYNKIVENLNEYLISLNELKIVMIFNELISLSRQILQAEKIKYINKSYFDNYKKILIDKLKNDKIDKKYLREFKSLIKNADVFTIIPKVWTLNPDKLTEHQVEKMKEKKCDIPALYNDINSYSQDTNSNSIKPWTPNKIVISKNKDIEKIVIPGHSEIIINSPNQQNNNKSFTSLISDDFTEPKPVESIIKAYCEISDTYDSSSTIKTDKSLPSIIEQFNAIGKNTKKITKKKKLTKKDEALLKKMNIQCDDEKRAKSLLRNIKSISIDTIEGNTFYRSCRKSLLDEIKPGIVTRRQEKCKNSIIDNLNKSKKKSTERKSLNNSNIINQESINLNIDGKILSKKFNASINSDDDIVESSQISESLISRRGRSKSTSSLLNKNEQQQTSKSMIQEPTDIADYLNDVEPVIDVVTVHEHKIPIVKMQQINFDNNELITISEMDTQLNTENLTPKLISSSTQQNQLEKKSSISQYSDANSSSISSHIEAHELFIGKSEKDQKMKKSPKSESVKELKSLMSVKNSPNKIADETMSLLIQEEQHQQENISLPNSNNKKIEEEVHQKTPSPTVRKSAIIEKEDLKKISELETQPNTEELLNNSLCVNDKDIDIEMPVTPRHRRIDLEIIEDCLIKSPVYSPIKGINNSSKLLTKGSSECNDNIIDVGGNTEFLNETPIKPINKSLTFIESVNKSITSSPECLEKKNEEFLNDTLNLSPIHTTPYKSNTEKDASAAEIDIGDDFVKTKDITDIIEKQQLSPVRKIIKPSTVLSSPPDRKSTSNSSSPGPKPKQVTPNLTGRGAQLINMIRNRGITSSGNRVSNTFLSVRNDDNKNGTAQDNNNIGQQQDNQLKPQQNNIQLSPTDTEVVAFSGSTVSVTPQQPRDLLVFSKVLPSPFANPSASILKRKCCNDSIDEFDSPVSKRKRVSFHDPPVSLTKEYVKNDNEDNLKISVRTALNKFLQSNTPQTNPQNINSNQQQQQSQNNSKHNFKRKSRANSMIELLRFKESPNTNQQKKSSLSKSLITTTSTVSELNVAQLSDNSDINNSERSKDTSSNMEIDPIKWNTTSSTSSPTNIFSTTTTATTNNLIEKTTTSSISTVQQLQDDDDDDDDEPNLTPSPQIYFPNEMAIFKHIFDKYTIDDIFEKYCENGYDLNNKNVRNVIKQISIKMEKDNKIKTNVLEMLSEIHPKEFLDHAIQENLSSVVCDRLNSSSVIDFVFEKSKINNGVRKIVFEKMENIVAMERFTRERHDFFMTMLRNEKFTNDEILECIEIISSKRTRNISGRGDGGTVESTSETVDSSSTL